MNLKTVQSASAYPFVSTSFSSQHFSIFQKLFIIISYSGLSRGGRSTFFPRNIPNSVNCGGGYGNCTVSGKHFKTISKILTGLGLFCAITYVKTHHWIWATRPVPLYPVSEWQWCFSLWELRVWGWALRVYSANPRNLCPGVTRLSEWTSVTLCYSKPELHMEP